jgi:hypothetical protein
MRILVVLIRVYVLGDSQIWHVPIALHPQTGDESLLHTPPRQPFRHFIRVVWPPYLITEFLVGHRPSAFCSCS